MADSAQGFIGPHDVLDGHRRAIRELGFFTKRKFYPATVIRHLDRFGQKAVQREGFAIVAGHQAFVGQKTKLPRNRPFQDVGVQAVKAADLAGDDPATFGGFWIGVG